MKNKANIFGKKHVNKEGQPQRWWAGLQARMTISYVGVTVGSVLFLEILVMLGVIFGLYSSILLPPLLEPPLRQKASQYALVASSQAKGEQLNPQSTFVTGRADSLVVAGMTLPTDQGIGANVKYINAHNPNVPSDMFALLLAPNGQIVASSYPGRYPLHTFFVTMFPDKTTAVVHALDGSVWSETRAVQNDHIIYAAAPVLSRHEKIIGVIYLEASVAVLSANPPSYWEVLRFPLGSAFLLLLITAPIGGLFGAITTRSLVRRIHKLATATTRFADGDYDQRVRVDGKDEVGQLEVQFNRMAEQLLESTRRRQELAAQNARLGERDRISRELHDAVSQDLFSLHMVAGGLQTAFPSDSPFYPQIVMLKQTTQTMIFEMRALLLELRPAQLAHLGLPAALEDLATAYRSRLGIEVLTAIESVSLPSKVEHAILRIAQEALSNAARHAEATAITLTLQAQDAMVVLTITDNGEGFELEEAGEQPYHSLGLRTMQERIQELAGTFDLKSVPGRGTYIAIYLPREEEKP